MSNEERWVFLDFAETLASLSPSDEAMVTSFLAMKGIYVDQQTTKALLDKLRTRMPYSSLSLNSPADRRRYLTGFNKEFLMNFGMEELAHELFEFMSTREPEWRLAEDSLVLLESLGAMNFKLGVASNFDKSLKGKLESLGVASYFSQILVSAEMGIEKPDLLFFKEILSTSGARPALVHYVGDSYHLDYKPARAVGLDAIHLSKYPHEAVPAGDQVRSLTEAIFRIKDRWVS